MFLRKLKIKKTIITLVCLTVVISLIITLVNVFAFSKTNYTFTNHIIESNKIPEKFNDFKIAYISDIHIKNKSDISRLKKIVNKLNENTLDLVLFGGDLYESKIINANEVTNILSSIKSTSGKFAILGNEDNQYASQITQQLNISGFEVLNNEQRPIYYDDSKIYLYGIGITGKNIINDNGYSIVFNHYPDDFNNYYKNCDLQLSGHSGGGYIYFPLFGSVIKSNHAKVYNHGLYTKGNATLIVSNGLSTTSHAPYKFLAKNEIIITTLKNT